MKNLAYLSFLIIFITACGDKTTTTPEAEKETPKGNLIEFVVDSEVACEVHMIVNRPGDSELYYETADSPGDFRDSTHIELQDMDEITLIAGPSKVDGNYHMIKNFIYIDGSKEKEVWLNCNGNLKNNITFVYRE